MLLINQTETSSHVSPNKDSNHETTVSNEKSYRRVEWNCETSIPKDPVLSIAPWRYGPARLWYDKLNVSENGEGFDYGFELQKVESLEEGETKDFYPDDAYLMVTQLPWEDDVIWDDQKVKHDVLAKLNDVNNAAGWARQSTIAPAFCQEANPNDDKDHSWLSILPVENGELVYYRWEDDVIWNHEAMPRIPKPRVLTIDRNDENIILEIPSDFDPKSSTSSEPKNDMSIIFSKAGVISEPEPSPPAFKNIIRDPFNISNDEFYNTQSMPNSKVRPSECGKWLHHSIPAIELREPLFPTHIDPSELRQFHRAPLKRHSHGMPCVPISHGVESLIQNIRQKAELRSQKWLDMDVEEVFFMQLKDLTGKDGELILAEYSEEHPPLLMQVGMATKIKNYYIRRPCKDAGASEYKYGETVCAHTSPFLGSLYPGQSIQAFENNLFRAPIYEHDFPDTDFLIIRTSQGYYIREVENIFTVGQEMPLIEVPSPSSKRTDDFIRNFLQVFIYRLFLDSGDNPRCIKMDDVRKAFPNVTEKTIRKCLRRCSVFKRKGGNKSRWVLKPDFRLPTDEEIQALVSPEQCCAYYSMLAAKQRLEDSGYGDKSFFAIEDDNEDELLADQLKTAPWNTTRAFLSAMNGKCLLELGGFDDPTGRGGFSYVRACIKPQLTNEERNVLAQAINNHPSKSDADLRCLNLCDAKQLLLKFNIPEEEINKLSRWEIIAVVRTLATELEKDGDEAMSKFARGNPFSIAIRRKSYEKDCQRMFDSQNQVLASKELILTDEETNSEDDSNIEEIGKNIENYFSKKETSCQFLEETEESERIEFVKEFMSSDSIEDGRNITKNEEKLEGDFYSTSNKITVSNLENKVLKIRRTFKDSDGKEFVVTEIVENRSVIESYLRIHITKDPACIRKFASTLDEQRKQENHRKRKLEQAKLRRLKKKLEREKDMPKKKAIKPIRKVTCGVCGALGHMKTNRACPLYQLATQDRVDAVTEDRKQNQKKIKLNYNRPDNKNDAKIVSSQRFDTSSISVSDAIDEDDVE